MKLLNRKSLILGVFLFQPFLATSANGSAGSCRSAVENLATGEASSKEIKSAQQDINPKLANIKAIQKDLNSGNQTVSREHLNEVWETVLFTLELQPIELARITKNLMQSDRYNQPASYAIIQKLINENRELIRQEGIFDLPNKIYFSQINTIHVGHGMQVRRLPLIEVMDAENPKLVALLIGLGADVYLGSPYNQRIISMMEGIVGPERNPNDFRIKYPIPVALERFYAKVFDREINQQILEILLENSDPNFRYNHSEMKLSNLFDIKYPGNPQIDKNLIYGVRDGATDLMLVAQYGTAKMLRYLIERGHDTTAKDKQGRGVKDYAQLNRQKDREEIFKTIEEYETQKSEDLSSANPARLDEDFVLGVSRLE